MNLADIVTDLELAVRARKTDERVRFPYGGQYYDPADRTQRMAVIGRITEDYFGTTYDNALLERLTDVILDDELTDPNPHKVAHTEYPFFSARQLELRRDRETGLRAADETGTDGRSYRKPTRRKRTRYENWRVDKEAAGRNAVRQVQYKRDTAPGRVVTYNLRDTGGAFLPEFVSTPRL